MIKLDAQEYVGNNTSIKVLTRTPQLDYPEHSHDFSELVLVKSGSGLHIVNNVHSIILPNSISSICEQDYHQYIDNKNVNLVNVLYNKQQLKINRNIADIIKRLELSKRNFLVYDNDFKRLESIVKLIENEQES